MVRNKKFWFLYRGSDLKEKYSLVYRYFKDNNGLIYEIGGKDSAYAGTFESEDEII